MPEPLLRRRQPRPAQALKRFLAGDPERQLPGMGIGPVLRPTVLRAFVDCAGFQQKTDRPTIHGPEIRTPVSR
jgi:hypothetical protein